MILKVETKGSKGWRYFAADEVQVHTDFLKVLDKEIVPDTVTQHEFCDQYGSGENPTAALVSFVNEKLDLVQILTEYSVYLLNNDGRNIDRLF